ncbi:DUF6328 family protein [Streptacidiphilus sp. PAMC 29251]
MTRVAARLIMVGLALLGLTIGTALLLLLRTATGDDLLSWIVAGAVTAWFVLCWLLLPYLVLRRAEAAQDRAGEPRTPRWS